MSPWVSGGGFAGARAAAPAATSKREGGARPMESPANRPVRCGRCRQEYAPESWGRLELVGRITEDGVRTVVTAWPDGVAVEIRRCHACGGSIARKREH